MNGIKMPMYQSHKKVWALKIETITVLDDGSADIVPVDENYGTFTVPKEYMDKHKPKEGGYFVQYEDGYKSFSPADAFEKGNTLVKCNVFSFGEAIEALRIGKKVARTGWNGKGMYLKLQQSYPVNGHLNPTEQQKPDGSGGAVPEFSVPKECPDGTPNIPKNLPGQMLSHIVMKTAGDSHYWGEDYNDYVPWLASQTDMLSYDWEIVE